MNTNSTATSIPKYGWLCDYETGEAIRQATKDEFAKSIDAASRDGGSGVIVIDGRSVYVSGESAEAHEGYTDKW